MRRNLYYELFPLWDRESFNEKIKAFDLEFLNKIVNRFNETEDLPEKVIRYLVLTYSYSSPDCIEGDDFLNTKKEAFRKVDLDEEEKLVESIKEEKQAAQEENESDETVDLDEIVDEDKELTLFERIVYLKDKVFAACVYDYLYYQNMREFTELMAKKQFYSDLILSVMDSSVSFDQRKKNAESLRELANDIRTYEQMVIAKIGKDDDADAKFKATKKELANSYSKSGRKPSKAHDALELEDYVS